MKIKEGESPEWRDFSQWRQNAAASVA